MHLQANVEKGMQLQERAALIADLQQQLRARPGQEALSQLSAAQVGSHRTYCSKPSFSDIAKSLPVMSCCHPPGSAR
jgi:hypothetical protein